MKLYREMSRVAWVNKLQELRNDPKYPGSALISLDGSEPEYARACSMGLEKMRDDFGQALPTSTAFDASLSERLHQASESLPRHVSEDVNFWRWLAITQGADLVEHRHGNPNQNASLGNFGLGSKWYSLFMRLWFRAELSYDEDADDVYWLTRLGERDFWDSGIIRHRYGSARNLVRALVKLQYPDPDKPTEGRYMIQQDTKKNPGIRTLYRRLSNIHATVAFDVLTEDECMVMLQELSQDLR